jgi:hypothetical protein
MKLTNLSYPEGSIESPSCEHHYCSDTPEDHDHMSMDVTDLHSLWGWNNVNEATYKELGTLIDGNFLNQKIRASALEGVMFDGVEEDTLMFRMKSSEFEKNRIIYQCMIKFDNWDEIGQDPDLNYVEKARMLLWTGNIRVHCSDPSFLYYYQYITTVLDASIYPEDRKPVRNNPQERGIVCKHLNRVLQVLPFHSGKIASAMKAQYEQG